MAMGGTGLPPIVCCANKDVILVVDKSREVCGTCRSQTARYIYTLDENCLWL